LELQRQQLATQNRWNAINGLMALQQNQQNFATASIQNALAGVVWPLPAQINIYPRW
jgi:hypothetical protein